VALALEHGAIKEDEQFRIIGPFAAISPDQDFERL